MKDNVKAAISSFVRNIVIFLKECQMINVIFSIAIYLRLSNMKIVFFQNFFLILMCFNSACLLHYCISDFSMQQKAEIRWHCSVNTTIFHLWHTITSKKLVTGVQKVWFREKTCTTHIYTLTPSFTLCQLLLIPVKQTKIELQAAMFPPSAA